jgi:crotonobetaine/carnitine-CoA ligase
VTEAIDLKAVFPPAMRTVPAMLERQARVHGDRPLFSCGGIRWSFRQTQDVAARTAGLLAAAGVSAGDRVALICGNRAELMQIFLGCAWLGAVSVPINTASRGFQLQHMLGNSGATLLIIEDMLLTALEGLDLAALPLQRIWRIGDETAPLQSVAGISLEKLPDADTGVALAPAPVAVGDLLTILYTSGTTGLSKGVCCPHGQFFWWGVYTGRQLGVREGDVLHTSLPLFHTNALNCFFQALLNGATQVVESRFSVSNFWAATSASGATVTYLLGAMVPMLLSRPPSAEERGHRVRVALAPGVPAHFHGEFTERTGIILLDGFGTTESNAVIGSTEVTRQSGRIGPLVEGFEAKVVDANDNEVPDGTAGELLLRAHEPFAMAMGYFGMPDKTVEAWRNLWLHTGDRVIRDPDGYYRFIDRMKDVIRRRGENVSSFEVEQVLVSHPAVSIAAVFPVSSELAEDEVMAAIILKDGAQLAEAELVRFCEGKMSYFAVPRFVEFVAEVPRTENGKVQKFKLRERGRSARTWDREAAGIKLKR